MIRVSTFLAAEGGVSTSTVLPAGVLDWDGSWRLVQLGIHREREGEARSLAYLEVVADNFSGDAGFAARDGFEFTRTLQLFSAAAIALH